MPTISVVLPTYNGENYIRQSIDSILNQTYEDFELIVVNDCSTDGTRTILAEYESRDARVHVIDNQTNQKLPKSLNIGFDHALGKYYTWTSDDNLFKKGALGYMVSILEQNPDVGLIYCDQDKIDEEGNLIEEDLRMDPKFLYLGDCIGACFMYRADIAKQIGGYDATMFLAEDYEYWLRIWKYSRVLHCKENLYQYRVHGGSLTATRQHDIYAQTSRLWMKYLKELVAIIPDDNQKYQFFDRIIDMADDVDKKEFEKQLCRMSMKYAGARRRHNIYLWLKKVKRSLIKGK